MSSSSETAAEEPSNPSLVRALTQLPEALNRLPENARPEVLTVLLDLTRGKIKESDFWTKLCDVAPELRSAAYTDACDEISDVVWEIDRATSHRRWVAQQIETLQ